MEMWCSSALTKPKKRGLAACEGSARPVPRGFKRQRQALFLCPARLREKPAVHLCECAIDVISYASLCRLDGIDWKQHNLLSLAGVYQPKKELRRASCLWPSPVF